MDLQGYGFWTLQAWQREDLDLSGFIVHDDFVCARSEREIERTCN